MKNDFIFNKAYAFALRVVKLYRYLCGEHKEFVLSKQLLRSGTAIGALLSEAKFAQSKADFINKQNIALKEANESLYWLNLLKDTNYLNQKEYDSIYLQADELVKLLVSSIKKLKEN